MEHETDFMIEPLEEKQPGSYEEEFIRDVKEKFSSDAQAIHAKRLRGESLTEEELRIIAQARDDEWESEYGFSFTNSGARKRALNERYGPTKDAVRLDAMQKELVGAFRKYDDERVNEIKQEYEERFAGQLEGVESLFGLVPAFNAEERLHDIRAGARPEKGEAKDCIRALTEYQFLLTHFILQNASDREFMTTFWEGLERLAAKTGNADRLRTMRRGILSQVAAIRIFEAIGERPVLAHPKEDQFKSIDAWMQSDSPIQIKSTHAAEPIVIPTDTISFPGVQVEKGAEVRFYNTRLAMDAQAFKTNVHEYEKELGKTLKGFLIAIPQEKIDPVTGEPDAAVTASVVEQLTRFS